MTSERRRKEAAEQGTGERRCETEKLTTLAKVRGSQRETMGMWKKRH